MPKRREPRPGETVFTLGHLCGDDPWECVVERVEGERFVLRKNGEACRSTYGRPKVECFASLAEYWLDRGIQLRAESARALKAHENLKKRALACADKYRELANA